MDKKLMVMGLFFAISILSGIVRDWKGIDALWVLQVGGLFTVNLMLFEIAWHKRHQTIRFFFFPTVGILSTIMLTILNLR